MKNEITKDEIWSKYTGTVVEVITAAEESETRQTKVGPQEEQVEQ